MALPDYVVQAMSEQGLSLPVPTSFKDPVWVNAAKKAEQDAGIPEGSLQGILFAEASDNGKTNHLGTQTPFQITKKTRDDILKKDGYDPFESPENAAKAAAQVFKDGLNKYKGNEKLAHAHYSAFDPADPKFESYYNRAKVGLKNLAKSAVGVDTAIADETPGELPDYVKAAMGEYEKPNVMPTNPVEPVANSVGNTPDTSLEMNTPESGLDPYAGVEFDPSKLNASDYYTPALETAGMVGGGAMGMSTGPAAPVAVPVGTGMGYALGKRAAGALDRTFGYNTENAKMDTSALQAVGNTVKDIGVGTAMDMGAGIVGELGSRFLSPGAETVSKGFADLDPSEKINIMLKAVKGDAESKAILASAAKENPELLQIYKSLGVDDIMPVGAAATDKDFKSILAYSNSEKGSLASENWNNVVNQTKSKSEEVLQKLGASKDLSSLDSSVKSTVEEQINTIKPFEKDLSDTIDSLVPPETLAVTNATKSSIEESLRGVDVSLLTEEQKKVYKLLTTSEDLQFGSLNKLRQMVGEALDSESNLFPGMSKRDKSMLYNALKADTQATVESSGNEVAVEYLKKRNELTQQRNNLQDGLRELYGKELDGTIVPTIKNMITKGAGGDASLLADTLKNVPEELRPALVSSGILRAVSKENSISGELEFDYKAFNKLFSGAMNNETVMKQLVDNLGKDSFATLSDLKKFSKNMIDLENSIKSVRSAEGGLVGDINNQKRSIGALASGFGRFVSLTAYKTMGMPLSASSVSGALNRYFGENVLMKADVAKVLSTSEFKNLVGETATKGYASPTVVKKLSHTKQFIDFAKANNLTDKEKWIYNMIQVAKENSNSNKENNQ